MQEQTYEKHGLKIHDKPVDGGHSVTISVAETGQHVASFTSVIRGAGRETKHILNCEVVEYETLTSEQREYLKNKARHELAFDWPEFA